ncbi:alpha,alpha-trehalase TreA [Flavihumibacter sp. CACIAM 22H1]|uniref:alpha,alpha-trehalase TreA n=1 Tax=Flavihumibacter sp. CACIAM 22H1 TaxID=1812911 RepID=UPI0007A7FD7E|nr:alpha,alpha-trehalase TreA [Flavihumibacter sp. CACIAM 22H1]KYP15556.1 MAG: alpha,alpha-trehalase [Flavihumibacter sp. CACIAM 22H1]
MYTRYTILLLTALLLAGGLTSQDSLPKSPDQLYAELFADVQMARIFPDSKTFADCIPKKDPAEILKSYRAAKNNPALRFSLALFVEENFSQPANRAPAYNSNPNQSITEHIQGLWKLLRRDSDSAVKGSSLLALPHSYIVPGGRFREIYYWDSYFTLLGLKESREFEIMENMIDNFAYLINKYGHIPNGNRTYYLSRSQPPFFTQMVELLASVKGDQVILQYLPAMEKEYQYWMEGAAQAKKGQPVKRVVILPDESILNRYWDELATPRPESYREDIETANKSSRNKTRVYQQLRAGAASGWDFSSRWLADGKTLATIETADIIPVDLNSLLVGVENSLARAYKIAKQDSMAMQFETAAEKRQTAIEKYCWSKELKFYTDYNFRKAALTKQITPAGLFPFVFFSHKQGYLSLLARQAAMVVQEKLLQPGGLQTSVQTTGEQWDAPNGWAPLQWMAVKGLARSGQIGLAKEIAQRWTRLNEKVYKENGKLMEKYNVVDLTLPAGGGEYAAQDGFGWTNGVYLALIAWLKQPV